MRFRFIAALVLLVACQNQASLEISPRDAKVALGEVAAFRAAIDGNVASVRWEASAGSITADGRFTAPDQTGVVTITANDPQNPGRRDQVNVTVFPSISSVMVAPLEPSLAVGQRLQFSSSIAGKGAPSQGVLWMASAGTIEPGGLFTAPSQPGGVTITATSTEDSRRSAQTTVIVVSRIAGLEVTPRQVTLSLGATQAFSAQVDGVGEVGVRWSASAGLIGADGRYTAPDAAGLYTVTATSLGDATKSASATVTVTNPNMTLQIEPQGASIEALDTLRFRGVVAGSADARVTWQATSGTISAEGVFTPPDNDAVITITATSLIDPLRSASTSVTVTRAAELSGTLFFDANKNNVRDTLEPPLVGWQVYLDFNNDGSLGVDEPSGFTDGQGLYRLPRLRAGSYNLRHSAKPGYDSSRVASQGSLYSSSQGAGVRVQVVGGTPASAGAQPYVTALFDARISDPFNAHYCGASLIAPNWLLTAAHCVYERGAALSPSSVQAGIGLTRLEGTVPRSTIAQIIVHPQYNPDTDDYDFALLKLSAASPLTAVAPLEPSDHALAASASVATVFGWGALASSGGYPRDLQRASLPITTVESCVAAFGARVTPRMICAGLPQGGVDACRGDSGGPLLVSAPGGAPLLAGATSWGEGCAEANKPGVYARVSAITTWLEGAMGRGVLSSHNVHLARGETQTVDLAVPSLP